MNTPWTLGDAHGYNAGIIHDADGETICQMFEFPMHTSLHELTDAAVKRYKGINIAKRMVIAVNHHEALVNAIKDLLAETDEVKTKARKLLESIPIVG